MKSYSQVEQYIFSIYALLALLKALKFELKVSNFLGLCLAIWYLSRILFQPQLHQMPKT